MTIVLDNFFCDAKKKKKKKELKANWGYSVEKGSYFHESSRDAMCDYGLPPRKDNVSSKVKMKSLSLCFQYNTSQKQLYFRRWFTLYQIINYKYLYSMVQYSKYFIACSTCRLIYLNNITD